MFYLRTITTINLSVHPSTAFVAAQDEEDLEQDDVYFKVKKQEGDVTFGRKGKSGKKRDLNKGGFSIKLHKVGQIDSRGKDVGRPPQSFKYTATRFNKSASFQGMFGFLAFDVAPLFFLRVFVFLSFVP